MWCDSHVPPSPLKIQQHTLGSPQHLTCLVAGSVWSKPGRSLKREQAVSIRAARFSRAQFHNSTIRTNIDAVGRVSLIYLILLLGFGP